VTDEPAVDSASIKRDERFAALYADYFEAIYVYVLRRAAPSDVADILQEVFAAAWRSDDRMPDAPEDRIWLYGVARRVVQRSRWNVVRRHRLLDRLETEPVIAGAQGAISDPLQARLDAAIAHLRERDRELLRLILWDQLDRSDVALLLGCSVNAVDIRFHRAIGRLRSGLVTAQATDRARPDHSPAAEL
jgi:RNA polymerase sigma-70 factor (ECF subfamily)